LSIKAAASSPRTDYKPDPATTAMALRIAERLDEKQATDIVVLDVSGPLVIADYFVIATVQSTRQGQSLAKELDMEHKAARGRRRRNTGGLETEDSSWVLLDFDDIVVHVFLPEARSYYALETLRADVPRLPFRPAARPAPGQSAPVRQPTLDGFGAFQPLQRDDEHAPPPADPADGDLSDGDLADGDLADGDLAGGDPAERGGPDGTTGGPQQ
jgi:ribosome-associated protein